MPLFTSALLFGLTFLDLVNNRERELDLEPSERATWEHIREPFVFDRGGLWNRNHPRRNCGASE
jgi:hypothetical protein